MESTALQWKYPLCSTTTRVSNSLPPPNHSRDPPPFTPSSNPRQVPVLHDGHAMFYLPCSCQYATQALDNLHPHHCAARSKGLPFYLIVAIYSTSVSAGLAVALLLIYPLFKKKAKAL